MAQFNWRENIKGVLSKLPFVSEGANGDKWFSLIGGANHRRYLSYEDKVRMVFSNPAVLSVFKLQCDLFSLAKAGIEDANGVVTYDDQVLKLLKKPNPFQTQRQFLWDFMFWNMIGCSNLLTRSRVMGTRNVMYWLCNDQMTFPPDLLRKLDKHYMSEASVNRLLDETFTYRYKDRTSKKYKLKEIKPFADLTNGTGNWFGSTSSIDALYKIISNSEHALDAKGINLKFSGKFMVGGDKKSNDMYADSMPMGADEQKSVEESLQKGKQVTAVRSLVDIKRFVENIANLKLDESYMADYFAIGKMYGIRRDVLEAFKSSTYENQEQATSAHVSYTLSPKGEDLGDGLTEWFGYDNANKKIVFRWDHLPFVQVLEKNRVEVLKTKAETLTILVNNGADANEVGEDLGFNYKFKEVSNGNKQSNETE